MTLHIRNMESKRCQIMVDGELNKLGIRHNIVQLGQVELKEDLSGEQLQLIDIALRNAGLELLNDKKTHLIEEIKAAIHQLIYLSDDNLNKPNFSDYISEKINRDYTYLSNLFSGMLGITIEQYIITRKIERVKEMLVYDKLSLSDIAYRLQYSSVAHLSNQFKKVTGLTPYFFRQQRNNRRQKS